ncbi:tail assembly protein [Morganella morganii]|uniref:tail assembly protein n=1 Tax=Morganella morganii TaxID=582 RepID=UPI00191FD31C|nr:tail assembly protein [Morganella morganii]EGT3624346.1 tail assembly protein [Morganella morganii]EGT3632330.1 tail assembly protein [Morganella morganii]EGT3635576.1 tail assembly protein [Morganella morganii]EKW8501272.1 tail assembly protein [Morganella morganii]ELJ5776637.1 tail assembly protein [Morganella morganii]
MQQEIMIKIELGGVLGKTFGKTHQRLISTTSEAVRALCCTIPGFEQFLNTSKSRGLTFAVFRGKKNIGEDDLGFPVTGEVIRIIPVVIGSKRGGLFQTIFGAVLVAAAVFMSGGIGAAFAAGGMTGFMATTGAAMMLGGIIQMLSPQPNGIAMKDQGENKPSYAFGAPTNTVSQGYPVPIGYGKRRIGGAVISAGIYVEDQQ